MQVEADKGLRRKIIPGAQRAKNILLLNSSPRRNGNTRLLMHAAEESLSAFPNLQLHSLSLAADGSVSSPAGDVPLGQFAGLWADADGILIGSPVYTFAPPSSLYAFFERLAAHPDYRSRWRFLPFATIVQGGAAYGGAEIATQMLHRLLRNLGGIPVSGDMPGSSQGVIGQVRDGSPPGSDLLEAAGRLAVRLKEMISILSSGDDKSSTPLRMLAVTAGQPATGAVEKILDRILAAARQAGVTIELRRFDFDAVEIAGCKACTQYCSRDQECILHDAMQVFRRLWLEAETVLWIVGDDGGTIPAGAAAVLDRMNEVRFETHFACGQKHMPRYLKAASILWVGAQPAADPAFLSWLQHTSLLYQNVLLPPTLQGRRCDSLVMTGLGTFAPKDVEHTLELLGQNLAVLALQLRNGLARQFALLTEEYYPSLTVFGKCGE